MAKTHAQARAVSSGENSCSIPGAYSVRSAKLRGSHLECRVDVFELLFAGGNVKDKEADVVLNQTHEQIGDARHSRRQNKDSRP